MFRQSLIWACLFSMAATQTGFASTFGYSVNINFGAERFVQRGAGLFGDQVWNSFAEPAQNVPARMELDIFGDKSPTNAFVEFESPGVQIAAGVKTKDPDDRALMLGFIDSPSTIKLVNLDQVIPKQDGPFTYTVILYTYGGREGEVGTYRVNDRTQQRVDTADFTGDFFKGFGGNVLVFENLFDPTLVIETDGFGPINALSLVYCRPGDFNGDGSVDVSDLEALSDAIKTGSSEFMFDVNFDFSVDFDDVLSWIRCSKGTGIGDVNLDGSFDSTDLVQLFSANLFDTGEEASWMQGDWNGDGLFNSADLLLAFQEGTFGRESAFALLTDGLTSRPAAGVLAVPEPASCWLVMIGSIGWLAAHGRRRCRPSR